MEEFIEISIRKHVKDFLKNRIKKIGEIQVRDFDFNPILIAAVKNQMKLNTARDLAEWLINQRIERGTVTAFGITLQKIAKEFSNEEPLSGFTMKLKKNGKAYNILITSGPNPYSKPQAIDTQYRLMKSKKIEPNSIPILGICYGNEQVLSSIVKKEMSEIKYYVGRDFWNFISGNKNCRDEIITIVQETGDSFEDRDGNSIKKMRESKITQIERDLRKMFGEKPEEFWKNVLHDIYI